MVMRQHCLQKSSISRHNSYSSIMDFEMMVDLHCMRIESIKFVFSCTGITGERIQCELQFN